MHDLIQQIVDELIDSFIPQSKCEFVSEFAVPLPIKVIAQQLGVPQADLPKFKQWSDAFIARLGNILSRELLIRRLNHLHIEFDIVGAGSPRPITTG